MELPKIIVVGATSRIARHCVRLWLEQRPAEVTLVGRDPQRLQRVAGDLAARSPVSVIHTAVVDFDDPAAIAKLVGTYSATGAIDLALVAHGSLPDQAKCETDPSAAARALAVNGISPALFAGALAEVMATAGSGTLVLLGSVAGDRGRKSNYVYGAAKSLLERYAQGLQHRLAGSGVRVCLVKPGPTATPMTAHLANSGPALASVEDVAACIVRGVARQRAIIYAPGRWALVMLVIRHLPRFIFNRLDI